MGGINSAYTGVQQVPWLPSDNGLILASGDPAQFTGTIAVTAGTVYLAKLTARLAVTLSNLLFAVTSAGSNTGGSGGTFAGLYSGSGALLTGSADAAALLAATGTVTVPLTTPQAIAAGTFVWAALVCNLGTTQPTLQRTSAGSAANNLGLSAALSRFATAGTLQTSLPSPITPSSNVQTVNGLLVGAS